MFAKTFDRNEILCVMQTHCVGKMTKNDRESEMVRGGIRRYVKSQFVTSGKDEKNTQGILTFEITNYKI